MVHAQENHVKKYVFIFLKYFIREDFFFKLVVLQSEHEYFR